MRNSGIGKAVLIGFAILALGAYAFATDNASDKQAASAAPKGKIFASNDAQQAAPAACHAAATVAKPGRGLGRGGCASCAAAQGATQAAPAACTAENCPRKSAEACAMCPAAGKGNGQGLHKRKGQNAKAGAAIGRGQGKGACAHCAADAGAAVQAQNQKRHRWQAAESGVRAGRGRGRGAGAGACGAAKGACWKTVSPRWGQQAQAAE